MERNHLITKEKMKEYCRGEDRRLQKSINDDLETVFEDIQNRILPSYRVDTYFLPELTEIENELVEMKVVMTETSETLKSLKTFRKTLKHSRKIPDSKSKFVLTKCERSTYRIVLTPDGSHFIRRTSGVRFVDDDDDYDDAGLQNSPHPMTDYNARGRTKMRRMKSGRRLENICCSVQ